MTKAFLAVLRWSSIFAFCSASSKVGPNDGEHALFNFKISLYVIVDQSLTARFHSDHKKIEDHVKYLISRASGILSTLQPPGSVTLKGCHIYRWGQEEYMEIAKEGEVLVLETLKKLVVYARPRMSMWTADLVMLLTDRRLVYVRGGKKNPSQELTGVARTNSACGPHKTFIIYDGNRRTVPMTIAHEIGHTLGSNHDGEGTSKDCPGYRYVMTAATTRQTVPLYSRCTIAAVNKFLRTPNAKCLFTDTHVPATPVDQHLAKRRADKCGGYLPRGDRLVATETYEICKFTCYTEAYSFVLQDDDDTPCDPLDPAKKCVRGQCWS
ncbi:snake venom metalloproteinase acutolysin-C-like isoform X2 [Rhipicephalus microplus]|uniref:snake venom metalloproteinase acutolysin-C-like isoform X2 n=1 Tax=Rhipicephalus microplus TaxID=6941 RepID=UPI003F6BC72B